MKRLTIGGAALAAALALAGCGSSGPGTITVRGQVLAANSNAAYTVATAFGTQHLCNVASGARVTITGASGRQLGWATLGDFHPLSTLTSGAAVGTYRFTVRVPAGQSHYGLTLAGIGGTLSFTARQIARPRVTC